MKEKETWEVYNLNTIKFLNERLGIAVTNHELEQSDILLFCNIVDNNLHSNTIVTISTEDGEISLLKSSTVRSHTNAPTHVSK